MTPKELKRFWAKVRVSPMGCWQWVPCQARGGYGYFESGGKMKGAHRIAYQHWKGPIPKDLQVDHLCRNPTCVNPAHLEAVTGRENILRGIGASAINARRTHCKYGHEFTKENTRPFLQKNGIVSRGCRACLRSYGLKYRAKIKERNRNAITSLLATGPA